MQPGQCLGYFHTVSRSLSPLESVNQPGPSCSPRLPIAKVFNAKLSQLLFMSRTCPRRRPILPLVGSCTKLSSLRPTSSCSFFFSFPSPSHHFSPRHRNLKTNIIVSSIIGTRRGVERLGRERYRGHSGASYCFGHRPSRCGPQLARADIHCSLNTTGKNRLAVGHSCRGTIAIRARLIVR